MLSGSTLLRHLAQFYCAIYTQPLDELIGILTHAHTIITDYTTAILGQVIIIHIRQPLWCAGCMVSYMFSTGLTNCHCMVACVISLNALPNRIRSRHQFAHNAHQLVTHFLRNLTLHRVVHFKCHIPIGDVVYCDTLFDSIIQKPVHTLSNPVH